MVELLVGRDVEAVSIQVLTEGFARLSEVRGVSVSTRIPVRVGETLSEFVRIYSLGGFQETLVTESTRMMVEGWARSEVRARRLWLLSRAILQAEVGVLFGGFTIGGPVNDPHPDYPGLYRYSGQVGVKTFCDVVTM